jgi:hypothetical protein
MLVGRGLGTRSQSVTSRWERVTRHATVLKAIDGGRYDWVGYGFAEVGAGALGGQPAALSIPIFTHFMTPIYPKCLLRVEFPLRPISSTAVASSKISSGLEAWSATFVSKSRGVWSGALFGDRNRVIGPFL